MQSSMKLSLQLLGTMAAEELTHNVSMGTAIKIDMAITEVMNVKRH